MEGKSKYGSISDLPDEELADPEELERRVFLDEWGAILALPIRGGNPIKPNIDEYFGVDWGAFATVDFERTMSRFDKLRYRVDKLREEYRWAEIQIEVSNRQVRSKAKDQVLKQLERGVIDVDHIEAVDMLILARWHLRARRLLQEIASLEEARARRKRKESGAFFG